MEEWHTYRREVVICQIDGPRGQGVVQISYLREEAVAYQIVGGQIAGLRGEVDGQMGRWNSSPQGEVGDQIADPREVGGQIAGPRGEVDGQIVCLGVADNLLVCYQIPPEVALGDKTPDYLFSGNNKN